MLKLSASLVVQAHSCLAYRMSTSLVHPLITTTSRIHYCPHTRYLTPLPQSSIKSVLRLPPRVLSLRISVTHSRFRGPTPTHDLQRNRGLLSRA